MLVRYNPEGDTLANLDQLEKLKRLADWLHANNRKFLFELLVPATSDQLQQVGGDTDRYDAELRPELMRRAIADAQDYGIEVDIWKIEGVDAREDAEMLAEQTRQGEGREDVVCVLLGRGASDEKVDHWLTQAAPVEGFVGFAIGRSIWWDALKGFLDKSIAARRGGAEDRRQLPALRQGLRGLRAGRPRRRLTGRLQQRLRAGAEHRRRARRTLRSVQPRSLVPWLVVLAVVAGIVAYRPGGGSGGSGADDAPNSTVAARVMRVVDGDTIKVDAGGAQGHRALHRHGHAGVGQAQHAGAVLRRGRLALQRTRCWRPGRPCGSSIGAEPRDRYGRLLAYVYRASDGLLVNAALLRGGFAHTLTIAPNDRLATQLRAARGRGARRPAAASGAPARGSPTTYGWSIRCRDRWP